MPKIVEWKESEILYLCQNYKKYTIKELSKNLNKSIYSIQQKMKELFLIKTHERDWNDEEVDYLKKHYQTMSYAEIGKILHRTRNSVQCKMRKLSLKKDNKYHYNSNFFNHIDNEKKAYWLGFIYADGYISGKYETAIELQYNDANHLRAFNKDIEGNIPVVYKKNYHINDAFIKTDFTESAIIRLHQSKMQQSLKKYGISRVKSHDSVGIPKEIPNIFIRDFVRGYYDGDGGVWIDKKRSFQLRFYIYGCNYKMLDDIKNVLYAQGIYSVIIPEKRQLYKSTMRCYRLKIEGIKNTIAYFDYLYDNAERFLDRKYIKARDAINKYNIRDRANKRSNSCLSV